MSGRSDRELRLRSQPSHAVPKSFRSIPSLQTGQRQPRLRRTEFVLKDPFDEISSAKCVFLFLCQTKRCLILEAISHRFYLRKIL